MKKASKIVVKNLHKAFGDNKVLRGVNLNIMPGESLVIIGGSGTGKSVLVKCILELLPPDKGKVLVDGIDICQASGPEYNAYLKKTGMLFQGGALFDSLSVWENIAFGLVRAHGMSKHKAYEVAIRKMARVGLTENIAELSPAELSGGMKKRVGLARAIATDPEIIFFDEPTTGLDPIMADVINGLIIECVKRIGATAITITHDMSSVKKIADRVAMLCDGKIIWQGTQKDLTNTKNAYVRQFVTGSAKGPIKMPIAVGNF